MFIDVYPLRELSAKKGVEGGKKNHFSALINSHPLRVKDEAVLPEKAAAFRVVTKR